MKKLLLLAASCLSVVFIYVNAVTLPSIAPQSGGYAIGDTAVDFSLPNVDGRMISLSHYKDAKGYVVVFTTNHCPYAESYEQRLINIHKKYAPLGFPVIAINPNDPDIVPDDNMDSMQKRAKERKYPFVYLLDEGQKVYPVYGATRTPHVFLLDSVRQVRYIGTIDDNAESPGNVKKRYLENAINALLKGEEPNPSFTRANGCMITHK